MSTIFAIASGNASRGISSCGLCQRIDAAHSKKSAAPRARTRPLSSLDVGREKDYLQCEGVLRPACGKGCAHEGMGRETAPRAPGERSSRRDIATCATRHAKEKRRGET